MQKTHKRGRIPGKGTFSGGRRAGGTNRKPRFDAKFPPIQCYKSLLEFWQDAAKRDKQPLTAHLREVLTRLSEQAQCTHENE